MHPAKGQCPLGSPLTSWHQGWGAPAGTLEPGLSDCLLCVAWLPPFHYFERERRGRKVRGKEEGRRRQEGAETTSDSTSLGARSRNAALSKTNSQPSRADTNWQFA